MEEEEDSTTVIPSQDETRRRLSSSDDGLGCHVGSRINSPTISPESKTNGPIVVPLKQQETLIEQSSNPSWTPSVSFKFCVECEDQSAEVTCADCEEDFCRPCFSSQHRRGKRSEHRVQIILGEMMEAPQVPEMSKDGGTGMVIVQQAEGSQETGVTGVDMSVGDSDEEDEGSPPAMTLHDEVDDILLSPSGTPKESNSSSNGNGSGSSAQEPSAQGIEAYEDLKERAMQMYDDRYKRTYLERTKYTPMRLTTEERRLLRVLESALNVSEYTDNVDTVSRRNRGQRILEEMGNLLSTILGLMVCSEPKLGSELVRQDIAENETFFQHVFEVGRRYKIMNPEKMRNTYGKLMYMLQDTQNRTVQPQLNINCVKNVVTVYSFLEEKDSLSLLQDARVLIATRDITDRGGKLSREEVAEQVLLKQLAAKELKTTFSSSSLSAEDIQRVLDSIADSNNYLNFNVGPVRKMLRHLRENFDGEEIQAGFSLAIGGGAASRSYRSRGVTSSFSFGSGYGSGYFRTDSAKLCHDHATHYTYVHQSLLLWREIMSNMYKLWYRADQDLLSTTSAYQLLNTGQGLNRVQVCPKVGHDMGNILNNVQRDCGSWVGLSVVHLGDRDVPNALMFIDKYTQVPRILSPVSRTVDQCNSLFDNDTLRSYAQDVWENAENLKMHILVDFFKHAFDGDGDDGGSCIDGRLTSAWNWCSKISKKPYYYALMLCNFQGFDGNFKD